MSISFDRAAGYYDQTRSLPDALMDQLVSRLVEALPREGTCLEIGIGTGRIALPLIQSGIRVVGVDISAEMLRRLREKAGDVPVAIADATRLPFADRTFHSAIASHVLHLIPAWKAAVDELARVVVPGGIVLASRSGDTGADWHRAVRRRFFDEAGNPPWPPGIDRIAQLDDEMRARGAAVRKIDDVRTEGTATISELIDLLEKGIWSACWSLDDETRRRAAAATRAWARQNFDDLDAPRPTQESSDWRRYVLPE